MNSENTPRPQLHRDWIDFRAFQIVADLQRAGHTTYLVGGCVRDLLVGIHPKDFDIATMAHPPQVKRLISQAYIIGRRFRLVLVKRQEQQFEVATFRRDQDQSELEKSLVQDQDQAAENEMLPTGDNIFGTPEEDARRRDFTINALFYDPVEDKLIDYISGLQDIQARCIRMIGDPDQRLVEDPIRILRALRLSHRIGFSIEPTLRSAMNRHASSLSASVLPRRREEILKILRLREPDLALFEAYDLGILKPVLPSLHDLFENSENQYIFFEHFRRNHAFANGEADTVHLFAWLIFSYFQTVIETEGHTFEQAVGGIGALAVEKATTAEVKTLLHEERFQRFMRDELGMYKFEQTTVMKAIEVMRVLPQAESYSRRGERRQFALVRNEGFQLALSMATVDYQLSPDALHFWKDLLERFQPEIDQRESEARDRRRRRRRDSFVRRKRSSAVHADSGGN